MAVVAIWAIFCAISCLDCMGTSKNWGPLYTKVLNSLLQRPPKSGLGNPRLVQEKAPSYRNQA